MLSAFTVEAENTWTKEEIKAFRWSKEYFITFDRSELKYNGLDSIQFVEYAANINKTSPENISTTLRFLEYEILKGLQSDKYVHFTTNAECNKHVIVYLKNLTEKAGLTVEVSFLYDGTSYGKNVKYEIADGRWNTFEQLVKENTQKLAKKIIRTMRDVRDGYFFE